MSQDEFGNWHSYTFGPGSTGEAKKVQASGAGAGGGQVVVQQTSREDRSRSFTSLSSFGSELTMVVHTPSKHRRMRRPSGSADPSADGFSQNAMAGSLAGESRTSAPGPGPQRSYVSTDSPPPPNR